LCLILGGVWLFLQLQRGEIEPLFLPTPTPTRTANSYLMEAEALFMAGDIEGAVTAYREAVKMEPDARVLAELARIQAYSSSLLSTDAERFDRLEEALQSIDQAIQLNPDDSQVLGVRAFVLDWYAHNRLVDPERSRSLLNEAEREAARAFTLDPNNAMALAFYAEILVDQQKWAQAQQYIQQAAALDPHSMDVHRVYGYVWESLGQYRLAIEEYIKAADINPNLTFLYIFIGRNFRSLDVHNRALEYFERAVNINEQLGVKDPYPYIEIAKTYTRDGEFFIAMLNAEKALEFNPFNPNTYAQLGTIYTKARNYEDAQPAFKCAVLGCSAEENHTAIRLFGSGVEVEGLPLTSGTVGFYYLQYASVLAARSRPSENYCPEAHEIMRQVLAVYPDDEIYQSIIQENQTICSLVGRASSP
jgi:tetratricopeptide (TPR) repeat protein